MAGEPATYQKLADDLAYLIIQLTMRQVEGILQRVEQQVDLMLVVANDEAIETIKEDQSCTQQS